MSSRTTVPIPVSDAKACKGKKQCFTCEQTFASYYEKCPHCKANYEVPLGAIDDEEMDWPSFDKQVASLQRKATSSSRQELVSLLYKRAMEVRYREPVRSKDLFKMVFDHDPTHFEARLKFSWQAIRLSYQLEDVRDVLKPIVESRTSTMEQKQRAYNNISCTFLFQTLPDYREAERYAHLGLSLDDKGTSKLWENYGAALRAQRKLEESMTAFSRALLLDPDSDYALKRQLSVEKQYKAQTKAQKRLTKESKSDLNKENSLNDTFRDPPSRSKSVKMLFTRRKISLGLTERAQDLDFI